MTATPALTLEIRELRQTISEASARSRARLQAAAEANREDDALHAEALDSMKALLATFAGVEHVTLARHWECPGSPIGTCFYDADEDPYEDYCLVCGDPRERK